MQLKVSSISARLVFRHLLLSVLFVFLFLLLNLPHTIIFARLGSSTWYPANGVVLALMAGVSPWYALLCAFSDGLAGKLIYHQPLKSFSEAFGPIGITFWYATAANLLRGRSGINFADFRGRDVVHYLTITAGAALGATATGVICLAADHIIPWSSFWYSAHKWFVADEIGLLALTPFLLIHVFPWVRSKLLPEPAESHRPVKGRNTADMSIILPLEGIGQVLAVVCAICIMFWPHWGNYMFFCFLPILWMAVRQGVGRVTAGIVMLTFSIVIAMQIFPPPPAIFSGIGLLMLAVSATGLIVGSTVTERHLIEIELRERTAYLDSLIENSPLGIVVLDQKGRVELVNEAFTKLFLLENRSELTGGDLDNLLPDTAPGEFLPWSQEVFAGQTLQRTLRRERRDGKILDLEIQAVPLAVDGSVRGAYAICRDISEQVRASKAEREHAVTLNGLVKELELQTDQMSLLNDMASMLESCMTVREACTVIQDATQKLFPDSVLGSLYTFRASRNLLEMAISWGNSSFESIFGPDDCWALRRGQLQWSDTAGEGITCPHLSGKPAARHICIPLVGHGETLGILNLGFPCDGEESPGVRYARQRLGLSVAGQIALSLASLQLHEKLRSQSIRDPLTGLFNRRFMQESLEKEIIRARRTSRSLSVLLIDIDNFKRFNDNFGHDAGDFVLQSLSDLLTRFFRGDDVTSRWGGEEFAVVLADSGTEHATARADSLRHEVKKLGLQYRGTALASITLSIGVATFPHHGASSEELLRIADKCLYRSKSAGRDCVTVASAAHA
jgi:diguanylate cyclase (GGDEF)-like protein/PAS domain S-box-containing protein